MKKFTFKLQNVLNHRQHIEKQKQKEYSVILNEKNEKENNLLKLNSDLEEQKDKARTIMSEQFDAFLVKTYYAYMYQLKIKMAGVAQDIQKTDIKLVDKQREMFRAMKDKKAIEIIRKQRYENYKKELSTAETKQMDEISTIKTFQKKRRESQT